MANFLPKERIEVQSVGAFGADNLAKDISGLMTATQGLAKTINKSMVSESEDIGKALARDSILEMVRKKNAYDQSIAENPSGFDYQNAKNEMDFFVSQKMADVKAKLGSDSVAYKAFEDGFLLSGTKYTEEYKSTLMEKFYGVERVKGIESEKAIVNETTNALGSQGVASSYERFKKLNVTDEQSSKYFTDIFLGKYLQSEFDARKLYDGATINRDKEIAEFNKFYDSIATMNKDGSIQGKHGFLQQDDLARIKQSWESKTKIVKEKNERNIGFHLAVDEAMFSLENTLPSNPDEATNIKNKLYEFVDKFYNQSSSPSDADKERYFKFRQDVRQKMDTFNTAYNVYTSEPTTIGSALATGSTPEGIKVDTQTVKRLVTKDLDSMLDNALENGNYQGIKNVIALEGQTGVSSTVANKFNSLIDFNKTTDIASLKSNLKKATILMDSGYTNGNEKLNKEMLEEYQAIVVSGENKGLDYKAIKDTLNEKKNDFILNRTVRAPEFVDNNINTLNRLTMTDDKFQEALGFFTSKIAGEVKVDRGTKTNSVQELSTALGRALAGSGVRLDSNRPPNEGDNLDKIKKSGYLYIIDNPFWNAELVILPDINEGSIKRPINGEHYYDGVKNMISITKNMDFSKVDMDKVRTEPIYNSNSGLKTKIYYDNVPIGIFSGNELSKSYMAVSEPMRTKNYTNNRTSDYFTMGQD